MDNNTITAKIMELRAIADPDDQQKEELAGLEVTARVLGITLPEGTTTPPVQEAQDFTAEPVQESPVTEPVVEPTQEVIAEPVAEPVQEEPVQEPIVEPTQEEAVTKTVTPDATPTPELSHIDIVKNDRKILWSMMEQLNTLKSIHPEAGRELSLAYTTLQESRHWLGEVLGTLGMELPSEYADKA